MNQWKRIASRSMLKATVSNRKPLMIPIYQIVATNLESREVIKRKAKSGNKKSADVCIRRECLP